MNGQKLRVLLFDPYGDAYGTGLANALSTKIELIYFTARNNTDKSKIECPIKYTFVVNPKFNGRFFFRVFKAFKLCFAYIKALKLIKKDKIDVIHIQWFQFYTLERFFLRKIRKHGTKIVFTSHNILPRVKGERFIKKLNKTYEFVDTIIVHGESLKNTFISLFPTHSTKIVVIKAGVAVGLEEKIEKGVLPPDDICKIETHNKIAIFFGGIFYNKGVDRLVKIWLKQTPHFQNSLLIIVGGLGKKYHQLLALKNEIAKCPNIIYHPVHVDEVSLNTYIYYSDFVIMPYREGNMSGVILKAANLNKTILATDVGAFSEYVDASSAFIVQNDEKTIEKELIHILNDVPKEQLKIMGEKMHQLINRNCSWEAISKETIEKAYKNEQ